MDKKKLFAIAAAVIAEEEKTDVRKLHIVSCRAAAQSSLERYIAEHGIHYKKYQLGD